MKRPLSTSSTVAIVLAENGTTSDLEPSVDAQKQLKQQQKQQRQLPPDGCHLTIRGWMPFMSVRFYVLCQGLLDFTMIMFFAYFKAIVSQV